MEQMHSLLRLQIRRYFGGLDSCPREWQSFIEAVNTAYFEFDAGRGTFAPPAELTSSLLEANPDFRAIFERLIHSSVDGIFAFDRDYRFTVWNPAVERILGLSKLQTLGQSAFDVFPFLKDTGGDKFYRETLTGKTVFASDRQYMVPGTGEQISIEGHFSPLLDDLGKIIGGLAILRDITERKRAEAALRERERELQQLADVIPHNILVMGPDGAPLYVNQGLREYFGFTLEDVQANDFRAGVYHPEDLDRVQSER